METTTFTPDHKITVVTDANHHYLLYSSWGCWQMTNILHQVLVKNASTDFSDRLADMNKLANVIKESKFIQNILDSLLKAGARFYVQLQDKTDWLEIGIRYGNNENTINWFLIMEFEESNNCSVNFRQSYNQVDGSMKKGYRHGEKVRAGIEKKMGKTFREMLPVTETK